MAYSQVAGFPMAQGGMFLIHSCSRNPDMLNLRAFIPANYIDEEELEG